jgi:hypothetical protein
MTAKKSDKASKAVKQVKTVKTEETTSLPILGYTCWWTIRKNTILANDFKDIIDNTLGHSFMPDSPSMRKALRNTLDEIEHKGIITQIPCADKTKIAYTLHAKSVDQVEIDLELLKEQTIVYDKTKDLLEIKTDYKRQEIMDLVSKYSNAFTDDDVRMISTRYLASIGAITMRETGGIYFIQDIDQRNTLRKFLEACSATLYDFTVFDTEYDRMTAHALVKDELESDLQKATEQVKEFLANRKENKRMDALESRLDKFKELQEKAKLYKNLLSNDIDDLTSQIEVVTDEVRAALNGEITAYPQAVTFPLHCKVQYTGHAKNFKDSIGEVIGYWVDTKSKNSECLRVAVNGMNKVFTAPATGFKLFVAEEVK